MRIFGSLRRREADATSDVDLLIRWRKSASLLNIARFRVEARGLLGRKVDTVEEGFLHWAIQPQAEAEAVPL